MKEYKLLQAKDINEIESQINEYINQGWTPIGNVSPVVFNGKIVFNQGMEREKTNFNEYKSDNGKQLLHG